MNWDIISLLVVIFIGYSHLLSVVKKRSIYGIVKLHVETREKDNDNVYPIKSEIFTKGCRFIVTPVPGMEFMAADIEGAVIKRVIIDDKGLLELVCVLQLSSEDNEFNEMCDCLVDEGWHKKVYV